MNVTTLIVDAPALIRWIHGLKQWIYDGSVRIAVPLHTLDEVERLYKASIAVKEAPKETAPKRASGRASRREEQPLFDINPRTVREFLSRARDNGDARVEFQKEGEEFSQWNVDEHTLVGSESQQEAPSSFADALLRKLNITNGSGTTKIEGDAKPKLLSKVSDPKVPWTHPGTPKVPLNMIPPDLKSFFSYVLWKVYEAESDPAKPIAYELFAAESRIVDIAAKIDISLGDWTKLKSELRSVTHFPDDRASYGQLEREFPTYKRKAMPSTRNGNNKPIGTADQQHGENAISTTANESSLQPAQNISLGERNDDSVTKEQRSEQDHLETGTLVPEASQPDHASNHAGKASQGHIPLLPLSGLPPLSELLKGTAELPERPITKPQEDSDLDSDEEIIVFNPRAKRGSWRPKTPAGASDPSQSRPNTSSGLKQAEMGSPAPAKSPIKSTLKPQSPVFTPGQLYSPVAPLIGDGQSANTPASTNGSTQQIPKSPARSPALAHTKPVSTKPTTGQVKPRQAPTNDDRRQQSEIIIQRQREAIHRQSNATSKPPPRRVQKEPTDNPTIIDPDAFDRSYVVQQPTQPNERGGKRRSGPKHKQGPKGHGQQVSGSQAEPDDSFVLKSGAPRGSTRGKGKLFVP